MKWRFDWPVNWRERVVGVILSVTLIGVTVLWVGALVWLVEKFVFGLVRKTTAAQRNWNPRTAPVGGHRGRKPLGGGLLPRGGLGSREQTIIYGSRPVRPRNAVKLGAGNYR